jgi:hypothetical protein
MFEFEHFAASSFLWSEGFPSPPEHSMPQANGDSQWSVMERTR